MNKKPLLITAGIVFILLVALVWVYLFLYGTPNSSNEVYSNLGFEIGNQPTTVTTPAQNLDQDFNQGPLTTINTDTTTNPLQQLTSRPVAGFIIVETASSTVARYVERGTGFVYDINLSTGVETQISQTTIPRVAEATFNSDGTTLTMTSYTGYTRTVFAGSLTNKSFTYITLEPGAHSVAFSNTGNLLYAISNDGTTRGYSHNLDTASRREVFTFDFVNTDVSWGKGYDSIYLSTRPGGNLPGYVYTINETAVTPVLPPLPNLHTVITPEHTIATFGNGDSLSSVAVAADGTENTLPITVIPTKCVATPADNTGLWCAAPITIDSIGYLDDWNKGLVQNEDFIWYVDINRETASLRANPDRLRGRTLDIDKINIDTQGRYLLMRDRTDQTLWLLDTNTI